MTVYLRPEAQEDLNAAADWYERQKPGLSPELLDEVLGALSKIEEAPLYLSPHQKERPESLYSALSVRGLLCR
jgi:plasmid stabilization system protein ParE